MPLDGQRDLLISGARIWSGWAQQPRPQALGTKDGKVAALGTVEEVAARLGTGFERLHLPGRAVLPAFHDAHCHPLHGGLQRRRCDLEGQRTPADCQAAVHDYARAHPDREWIVGGGWSMETFANGTPSHELLDQVTANRPAFLTNRDGHSAWVNQKALARAGIAATTPDPPHGRIERDPDGAPQGTLHEAAMGLVGGLIPAPREEELVTALLEAQRHLHSLGLVGWQDASVDTRAERAYGLAHARGELTARVRLALWWERDRGLEQIPELEERRARLADEGLDAGSVKVMLDGVMETYTAALLEPYLDPLGGGPAAGGAGHLFLDAELAREAVTALDRLGFQVHFHAIGDRAVRVALDSVAAARSARGEGASHGPRHQIAHLQLIDPDDIGRFRELGVTANIQPFWACHEPQMDELTLPYLGELRGRRQYPFRSLLQRGARLAGGSDWPVSTADPLQEMAVAVSRVAPDAARHGEPALPPFLPEERIGLEAALTAFTRGSAYVSHLERRAGDLGPGKWADLVVLAQDPFQVDPDRLPEARVELTMVGGRVVYQQGGG